MRLDGWRLRNFIAIQQQTFKMALMLSGRHSLLEAETRKEINARLLAAGWAVQNKQRINLTDRYDTLYL